MVVLKRHNKISDYIQFELSFIFIHSSLINQIKEGGKERKGGENPAMNPGVNVFTQMQKVER